jgi:hypothetical protein
LAGQRAFVTALDHLPELREPSLVLLDFGGVDFATSSYLSAVMVPLRDHLRQRRQPGYAVAANLTDKVRLRPLRRHTRPMSSRRPVSAVSVLLCLARICATGRGILTSGRISLSRQRPPAGVTCAEARNGRRTAPARHAHSIRGCQPATRQNLQRSA